MKFYTNITLFASVFSYIDQPCIAGKYGNGVCVKKSSYTLYGKQQGKIIPYTGSSPNWPYPNDLSDVICCVKEITRLRDGVTKKEGRYLILSNVKVVLLTLPNTQEVTMLNNVLLTLKQLLIEFTKLMLAKEIV